MCVFIDYEPMKLVYKKEGKLDDLGIKTVWCDPWLGKSFYVSNRKLQDYSITNKKHPEEVTSSSQLLKAYKIKDEYKILEQHGVFLTNFSADAFSR